MPTTTARSIPADCAAATTASAAASIDGGSAPSGLSPRPGGPPRGP
ncbi:hypothetical protein NKG05_21970 [Oerskovia sp. M15]